MKDFGWFMVVCLAAFIPALAASFLIIVLLYYAYCGLVLLNIVPSGFVLPALARTLIMAICYIIVISVFRHTIFEKKFR